MAQTEFTTCYLKGCFCSRYTLRLASKTFLVSRSNGNGCKLTRITGTCLRFGVATLWHLVSSFLWQHSPSLDPFHKETNLEQDVIFLFKLKEVEKKCKENVCLTILKSKDALENVSLIK